MADIRRRGPAAREFGSIGTDNNFSRSYEDQAGLAIDGSNDRLRTYSPFVIRLVPPAILGNSIASGGFNDPYSRDTLTIQGSKSIVELPPPNQVFGTLPTYRLGSDGRLERTTIESLTPLDFVDDFTYLSDNPGQWLSYQHIDEYEEGRSDHRGIDIYIEPGAPVYAPFDSVFLRETSVYTDPEADGGRNVVLQSAENPDLIVKVMHLRDPVSFSRGQQISEGTLIGFNYTSDRPENRFPGGTSSHLHVETIVDGDSGSRGQVNGFGYFDVSRLAIVGGAAGVGVPGTGGTRVVRVGGDTSQASQIGVYAAAAQSLSNRDVFNSFEDGLRSGALGSVTEPQLRELQQVVNSEGELTTPGQERALTPAIQNRRMIADIIVQIIEILRVPPIQLLINPQQLQLQFTKIAQFQDRSRHGYIYQAWGEEQPVMTVQGRIGGFYTTAGVRQDINTPGASSAPGLQYAAKHDSAAWQQFMALLGFYQNNGYVFDRVFGSKAYHMIGTVAIDYDQWTYVGNFTSFEYGYSEEKPNGDMEFSFEFKVSRVFDNSTPTSRINPYRDPNRVGQSDPLTGPEPGTVTSGTRLPFAQRLANFFLPPDSQFQPPAQSSVAGPGSDAWVEEAPGDGGDGPDATSSFDNGTFGV